MATYNFNGTADSLLEVFGSQTMTTALLYVNTTEFGFTNADGSNTYVYGTGFSFDAATGAFNGGTITGMAHYSGGNYVDELDGVSVSASNFQTAIESSPESLRTLLLSGDDLLRGLGATSPVLMYGNAGNDTIYGGSNADTLFGGAGNDVIRGYVGDDTIDGDAGADNIRGGSGFDTLNGGDGDDVIFGNGDSDFMTGGAGDDRLFGGADGDVLNGDSGNDRLRGNSGDDVLDGGTGNDDVRGGKGDDVANGQDGNDYMWGGDGDDIISGGDGVDHLYGGDGIDVISGGNGVDVIRGNAGNDIIFGGDGNDDARGGVGDDTVTGGNGNDWMNGGVGFDTAVFSGTSDQYTATTGGSANVLLVSGLDGDDTVINFEAYQFDDGTFTWNNKTGSWIETTCLDDIPAGTPIEVEIQGTNGNDNLNALTDENTAVCAKAGNDTINTKNGDDWVFGGDGDDNIRLDFDTLSVKGNSNDHAFGEGGNDILRGRGGDDVLDGGTGNDILRGGDDNDQLTGGSGADLFVFRYDQDKFVKEEWGNDVVTDFEMGVDHLQFEWGFNSLPPLQPADLVISLTTVDADTVLITGVPGNIGSVTVHGDGVGSHVLDDFLL